MAMEAAEVDVVLQARDGPSYEFVNGELRERHISFGSCVTGLVSSALVGFVRPRKIGAVTGPGLGIRIFQDPMTTRKADVAFLEASRVPRTDQGFLRVPPDLVVEVVSPGDKASEIRAKTDEWLQAGVKLVWVVYPAAREVQVYPASGRPQILGAGDEISGGDVIPGFTCSVAEFFPH